MSYFIKTVVSSDRTAVKHLFYIECQHVNAVVIVWKIERHADTKDKHPVFSHGRLPNFLGDQVQLCLNVDPQFATIAQRPIDAGHK